MFVRTLKPLILGASLALVLVPALVSARTLTSGLSGSDVTALQQVLSVKGYLTAVPTGYFGPATLAGVKKFQCDNHIVCSGTSFGVAGPQTQAVLGLSSGGTSGTPAKGSLEVSGWIPYWRTATGTADVLPHLDQLAEINPFGYVVQKDGVLTDAMGIADDPWKTLIVEAKKKKVRVVPTIMWSDTAAIHNILSNQKTRIALEDDIAELAKREGFDGVDIDFEGKRAEDKQYFSLFLKGLYQRMGKLWVMCTIESRIPIEDRYFGSTPPEDAGMYANDFVEINKYCDRVRFMTYDQQLTDQKIAADYHARGEVYAPLADTVWVEKAIKTALKTIPKNKVVLGIATYGYEWQVTAYADGYVYDLLWSFNPNYATPIASAFGVTPVRNGWGEMSFSYVPTSTQPTVFNTNMQTLVASAPAGTSSGDLAAAGALRLAQSNNTNHTFRYMTWSDATSIKAKVDLAKKLGIRGVAVFKFDGGEDPGMWNVLK